MITENFQIPLTLSGEELDDYLSKGWYRMGSFLFTTDYLFDEAHPVTWLRIDLSKLLYGNSQKKILKKNARFAVQIKPFALSAEIDELFYMYKTHIDFMMHSMSVMDYLHNLPDHNIFDTQQIEMRDGDKLIGAGFFDLGANSAAGIFNIYHPDYARFSLGKFLMMVAVQYCVDSGRRWFYPGYIVEGMKKFDYKLFLDRGATERFDRAENKWF